MAVLDDLSGFEFKDLMEDVFRNLAACLSQTALVDGDGHGLSSQTATMWMSMILNRESGSWRFTGSSQASAVLSARTASS